MSEINEELEEIPLLASTERSIPNLDKPENFVDRMNILELKWRDSTKTFRDRFDAIRLYMKTDPTERSVANRFRQFRNFVAFTLPVQVANLVMKPAAVVFHSVKAGAIIAGRMAGKKDGVYAEGELTKTWKDIKKNSWDTGVAIFTCSMVSGFSMGVSAAVGAVSLVGTLTQIGFSTAAAVGLIKIDAAFVPLKKVMGIPEYLKNNPKTIIKNACKTDEGKAMVEEWKAAVRIMRSNEYPLDERRQASLNALKLQEELADKYNPIIPNSVKNGQIFSDVWQAMKAAPAAARNVPGQAIEAIKQAPGAVISVAKDTLGSAKESIKSAPSAAVKTTKEVIGILEGSSKTFMESTKVEGSDIQPPTAAARGSKVEASRPKGRY